MDLRYDGKGPPKLLEYNADTPTSLIEAAVAQWNWLQAVHPRQRPVQLDPREADRALAQILRRTLPGDRQSCISACVKDNEEDLGNLEYLRDTAMQAGIDARQIYVEDIGWSEAEQCFVDLDDESDPRALQALPVGMDDERGIRPEHAAAQASR